MKNEIGKGDWWLTGGMSPEEILSQLPAAATLCRVGRSKQDLAKPKIAILHAQNCITPGHYNLLHLVNAVAQGIKDAGGFPIDGSAGVGMCDGIVMGHKGMLRSLYSRETNADSVEEMLAHGVFNGVVLLGACDKNIPGYHMGAGRANIPSIFVTPGPMW